MPVRVILFSLSFKCKWLSDNSGVKILSKKSHTCIGGCECVTQWLCVGDAVTVPLTVLKVLPVFCALILWGKVGSFWLYRETSWILVGFLLTLNDSLEIIIHSELKKALWWGVRCLPESKVHLPWNEHLEYNWLSFRDINCLLFTC